MQKLLSNYKNKIIKHLKIDLLEFTPIILLFWGVYSILFRDIIPIASGFGWDGVEYGKIALNFEELIGKLDAYRAGRIFPSILIYYALKIFHLPTNLSTVLIGFQVYSIIILTLSSFTYNKIVQKTNLTYMAKWIGFIALFINYPLLNLHFYYPALTDGTVFFLALLYIYSFFSKNSLLILITSVFAFFTWPTMIYVGIILYVFLNNNKNYWNIKTNNLKTFLLTSIIISPLIIGYIYNVGYFPIKSILIDLNLYKFNNNIIEQFSYYKFTLAILNILFLYFVYYYTISKINLLQIIKDIFAKENIMRLLVVFSIISVLLFLKSQIQSNELATFTTKDVILRVTDLSLVLPFQYLIGHITYYGPIIVILLLNYKHFINSLKGSATPILFILIICLFFSIGVESRGLINFYPFIVVFLIININFQRIKNKLAYIIIFTTTSIILSKIWFIIKLPSTKYPICTYENLDKFPMQNYFMNFGPWQNFDMYLLHTLVAVLIFILFYVLNLRE